MFKGAKARAGDKTNRAYSSLPATVSKTLALFRGVISRYARPGGRGGWPPLRLFYLPGQRSSEGVTSREPATTLHVIQQPVPWPRALTERISSSATRFVERVVARVGRVKERIASPLTGAAELVYVLGRASTAEDLAAAVPAPARVETSARLAEVAALYGTAGGEWTGPGAPAAGGSIYDAAGVGRARVSPEATAYGRPLAAAPDGEADAVARTPRPARATSALAREAVPSGVFAELVYGPGPVAAGSARRDGRDFRTEAEPGAPATPGAGVGPDAFIPAAAETPPPDYFDITANLDYEYLGERLFKMFEQARRIEMERRGLL
jgi:hypothetical protein